MKLTMEQIKSITQGAVHVSEENGRVKFHRFTAEQEQAYKEIGREDFYIKTFATAGIQLAFKTDSEKLFLKVFTSDTTSRSFFAHDVLINGERVESLDNFSGKTPEGDQLFEEFPLGEYSKQFNLGKRMKEVRILFPFSVCSEIMELSMDDGADIIPLKKKKKMIFFGDSITQGYDAVYAENHYTEKVASALGAEGFNKGIGGDIFFPQLAKKRDYFEPDYVVVAYGTNDWGLRTAEEFTEKCREFYSAVSDNYPNAKIFALTPIWRKDNYETRKLGTFFDIGRIIGSVTENMNNVICLSGWDFIPHEEKYYSDLRLHPNDDGFAFYAENLIKAIRQYI